MKTRTADLKKTNKQHFAHTLTLPMLLLVLLLVRLSIPGASAAPSCLTSKSVPLGCAAASGVEPLSFMLSADWELMFHHKDVDSWQPPQCP